MIEGGVKAIPTKAITFKKLGQRIKLILYLVLLRAEIGDLKIMDAGRVCDCGTRWRVSHYLTLGIDTTRNSLTSISAQIRENFWIHNVVKV